MNGLFKLTEFLFLLAAYIFSFFNDLNMTSNAKKLKLLKKANNSNFWKLQKKISDFIISVGNFLRICSKVRRTLFLLGTSIEVQLHFMPYTLRFFMYHKFTFDA